MMLYNRGRMRDAYRRPCSADKSYAGGDWGRDMRTELRKIPGVGPETERDLINLGYTTVESLKGQDPEDMYMRDCLLHGRSIDRCQLYVYRCAVYYASTENPDPEKLKWWNWKDEPVQRVQVVPAVQKSQLRAVSRLAEEIWHEHYADILSPDQIDYMVEKFQSFEAICEQTRNEGYQYFLLLLDGEEAGYMGLKLEEDRIFLSKLYLLHRARGNGVASVALEYMQDMCCQNGLSGIWLTVNKHNTSSIAVYEHMGFQRAYSQTTDIGRGYVMDDYVMEKMLH